MKFVSLLSSGIDSPVATYMLNKYADEFIFVHGDIGPFTDKRDMQNFLKISKYLKRILNKKITIYTISHGEALSQYKKNCDNKFTCVFCKRMLLRYAEKIANESSAEAIIMGDSLGQVASQTIKNLAVVDKAVKIPILRPLIGYDKEDVIKIAKEIGTYELSILPTSGCSAVPNKPSTQAKIDKIEAEESKIVIQKLVKQLIQNSKKISI
jgi:thiamine biosynthesis protein ThiI